MKKYLLGVAAALAIVAPGVASAQSGYVDLGYTNTDVGGGTDADTWALGGAAVFGGENSLGFQVDGSFGNQDFGGGDVDLYNIGGHVFTRNDSHMIGGFVGYGSADFGPFDYDYWTVGAEGAIYADRNTFSGVLSYSDANDFDATITSLDVGVTHFVTDNFSIGGGVGIGTIDSSSSNDLWQANLGAEYQFASLPISLYGGYQHNDYDGFETDALTAGVRYNFGGTLLDRDRSGASLSRGNGFARLGGIL